MEETPDFGLEPDDLRQALTAIWEDREPEQIHKRDRRDAQLTAVYQRIRQNPAGAALQEKLIEDARLYAETFLGEGRSPEARLAITRWIWEEFIPHHKKTDWVEAFHLSFNELHASIWDEGYPSLQDKAEQQKADEDLAKETAGIQAITASSSSDRGIPMSPSASSWARQISADESVSADFGPDSSSASRTTGPVRPRRTPNLDLSRNRLALVNVLARELAIVKHEVKVYCTVEELKRKHPKFTLWSLIEDSQIKALVDGEEFVPKAYAENLTLMKFGLTSRETLKKDRQKLRKAEQSRQT